MKANFVWMNGELKPWAEANVHIGTHALHYGSGVFEGIRAYQTPRGIGIFRLQDHLKRFETSGDFYRMSSPYTREDLTDAIWSVIEANQFKACYVRPLMYRGLNQLGVYPLTCPVDVAILAWEWGAYLGDEAIQNGIKATISSVKRFSDEMMPTAAKATGQYLNSILAKLDASERGYEEAIMLNADNMLSEGSGENIFLAKDGVLYTPRVSDSILGGITRRSILQMSKDLKIPYQERAISPEELFTADEIFVTGTAAEVTPVKSVDDKSIGTGKPGPITRALQDAFFQTVHGENTQWASYLEYR